MPGQAQTGKRRSIPKITNVKADDSKKLLWKNVGNNHAYPMIWADTIAIDSEASVVVAEGVTFHGMTAAENGNISITPVGAEGSALYVVKDVDNNIVTIEGGDAFTGDVDVQIILGENTDPRFIENYVCRGNNGATKNF